MLTLSDNPVSKQKGYRERVAELLPNVILLDEEVEYTAEEF